MKRFSVLFAVCLGVTALSACSNQKPEPQVASSAGMEGYASRYPNQLAATRGRFDQQESQARQLTGAFATYPDQLDKPNWADVTSVVDKADSSGRSNAYVQRAEADKNVSEFFDDEKGEIEKKVGGAANYAIKKKGCDADAYGATSHALETSVDKQLEKRMRERNEAQDYIDDHEDSLGKNNVDKLKKQADNIAYASYLSNIAVIQTKVDLKRMLAEGSDVKSTLERSIKDEQAAANDANRSDSRRKAAQARLQADQDAESRIDSELSQAQTVMKEVDDRVNKLKAEYDQALKDLRTKIQQKQQAAGDKS